VYEQTRVNLEGIVSLWAVFLAQIIQVLKKKSKNFVRRCKSFDNRNCDFVSSGSKIIVFIGLPHGEKNNVET
jgi:hypothetical protein